MEKGLSDEDSVDDSFSEDSTQSSNNGPTGTAIVSFCTLKSL